MMAVLRVALMDLTMAERMDSLKVETMDVKLV
jgi:hypothetical protein